MSTKTMEDILGTEDKKANSATEVDTKSSTKVEAKTEAKAAKSESKSTSKTTTKEEKKPTAKVEPASNSAIVEPSQTQEVEPDENAVEPSVSTNAPTGADMDAINSTFTSNAPIVLYRCPNPATSMAYVTGAMTILGESVNNFIPVSAIIAGVGKVKGYIRMMK